LLTDRDLLKPPELVEDSGSQGRSSLLSAYERRQAAHAAENAGGIGVAL